MTINVWKKGALARVRGVFRDVAGALVDPTTVSCRVTKPSGTPLQTTSTYSPGDIVRESLGTFYLDVSVDVAGEWHYVWISTGTGQATEHGVFNVEGKA
jgi:hypothetical protein